MATVYTNDTGTLIPAVESCTAHKHAICWGSVIAGAVAAIAFTFVLMVLQAAFGLSISSPWSHKGFSAEAVTASMIIAMILVQWFSSALGGFIAGRLRGCRKTLHTDEVCFRDIAHGFLTWCVATLVIVTILSSAIGSIASGGAKAATAIAAGAAAGAAADKGPRDAGPNMDPMAYTIDTMFRDTRPSASVNSPESRAEATRILANAVKNSNLTPEDRTYLGSVIANRTGVSQAEGEARVDRAIVEINDAKAKAKEAADKARKAAATLALFTFISLMLGAFIASVFGHLGGKCRDDLHNHVYNT